MLSWIGNLAFASAGSGRMPDDEEWRPPDRFRLEPYSDLEREARRLAALTRTAQQRAEDAARRLHARLNGWVPFDEAVERAEQEQVNGTPRPYPQKWYDLAEQARRDPSPLRPRFNDRSRPYDGDDD